MELEEVKELKKFKEEIKKYDFFKEGKEDFYDGRVTKSNLVYGEHWTNEPMITVIIPTCRRPKLLKQALESALGQENFTDYQILVVDNEEAALEQETETSILMKGYRENNHVIYYRNCIPAYYRMDTAISYARSKWVCFLHDDDLLVKNHLAVMTDIVESHHGIFFLGCPAKVFYNEINESEYEKLVQPVEGSYSVIKYSRKYLCTGYAPGWLGALIDREKYIAIGGMPQIDTGIGDFIMQGKFMNKWGAYQCVSFNSLYRYRQWEGQASAKGESVWLKGYMAEYYWYKYLNKKFHSFTHKFWDRASAYRIIMKCTGKRDGYYGTEINMDQMKEYCEWDKDMFENKLKKKCCLKIEHLYMCICSYIAHHTSI
ncbi:hypothetical protein C819_02997 [Lachnospiraceae bacterium 10-1]|nr:hypothetical protein C819_02997 [Lachnospiraceae bacterium 10-1]